MPAEYVEVEPDVPSLRVLVTGLVNLGNIVLEDYDDAMSRGEYSEACHAVLGMWILLEQYVAGNVEGLNCVHKKVCTHG